MREVTPEFGNLFLPGEEAYARSIVLLAQMLKSREASTLQGSRSSEWVSRDGKSDASDFPPSLLEEVISQFVEDGSSGDHRRFFNRFRELGTNLFRSGYPPSAGRHLVEGFQQFLQRAGILHLDDPMAQAQATAVNALAGEQALVSLLEAYYSEQARVSDSQLQRMAAKARISSLLWEEPLTEGRLEGLLREMLSLLPCERISLGLRTEASQPYIELTSSHREEIRRYGAKVETGAEEAASSEAAVVSVPVEVERQPRGQLTVWFAASEAATPERRQLVHWIGAELERRLSRPEQAGLPMAKLQEHLVYLFERSLSASSRAEEVDLLLMGMADALHCGRALLFGYDREHRELQAEAGIDCDTATLKALSLPLDHFRLAKAAIDRQETIVSLGGELSTLPPSLKLRFDVHSAMAVAVRRGRTVTGLALFGDTLSRRAFEPEQIALATFYGQILGLARQDYRSRSSVERQLPSLGQTNAGVLRRQALDELSRAVRHEVNNPLTAILGNAQLLLERTDLPSDVYPRLREVESLSLRIRDILQELKTVKDQTAVYVGESKMIDLNPELPQPTGKRRALVVDDEPTIVQLLTTILTAEGYDVSSAADGPSAINQLESSPYDLVFLDFKLPGVDGRQVYHAIERKRPEVSKNVIFVTGDTSSEETLEFVSTVGCRFLRKPFTFTELRSVISGTARGN